MIEVIREIIKELKKNPKANFSWLSSFWEKMGVGALLITFFPRAGEFVLYSLFICLISSVVSLYFLARSLRE